MVVKGLVLGQSVMVVSYAKVPPFIIYNEVCCFLHVKYIVYKHVNT